jgi:hypothetical protein
MAGLPTLAPIPLATTLGTFGAGLALGAAFPGQSAVRFMIQDVSGSPTVQFGVSPGNPLEIPERLDSLGGEQMHAIHAFPGGIRTVQALGPLPRRISWTGMLFGGNALMRSFTLDSIRKTGNMVYLWYGSYKWQGLITSYKGVPRHQNWVDYTIEFEPSQDLTSTVADLTPVTPESILASFESTLSSAIASATGLSAGMLSSLTGILSSLGALLLAAGGTVAAIPLLEANTLKGQITTTRAQLVPVRNNTANLPAASSAAAIIPALDGISATIPSTPATVTTIQAVNPNLPTIASAWMGDPSLWPQLAKANGLLDPSQTGVQELNIPAPSGVST